MAHITYSKDSTSSTNLFNEYLNISIEVAPGIKIKMPLNCAIPGDGRNMSADQKKLMEIFQGKLDKAEVAAKNGASEEELEEILSIHCPIHGSLYRRKSESETDTSDWTHI